MVKSKKDNPAADFFHETGFDPLIAAVRGETKETDKKKAGFYLSHGLLERFDKTFYTLKIEGQGVDNKSAFVEKLIDYALDVLDRDGLEKIIKKQAG